jgi:hypothetical protein
MNYETERDLPSRTELPVFATVNGSAAATGVAPSVLPCVPLPRLSVLRQGMYFNSRP